MRIYRGNIVSMILLQNWTELMHFYLKLGIMLILIPWNQLAISDSHVNYANFISGQNLNCAFRIVTLKEKAIRIINNQPRNSHSSLLFKKNSILKFEEKILINNIITISKSINNLLLPIFKNWFIFCSKIRSYDTVSYSADKLFKPSYRTDSYGKILCYYRCY